MSKIIGWGARLGALFNDNKGSPWGSGGGGGGGEGDGPRNPWGQPPKRRRGGSGGAATLDDLLKRGRDRFGGRFPSGDGRPWWIYIVGVVLLLWLVLSSAHLIGPQERGVISRLGKYAGTMQPGMRFSFPWPIDSVTMLDVSDIREVSIGSADPSNKNFILTGDQNIIDVAYQVRWNIKDPELYIFQMRDTDETIQEVAQFAMRASMARVSLNDAIGSGRAEIEQRVTQTMQQLLDAYGAGVAIQGVAIKQSDPPAAVNDAFKAVSAAQQDAQSDINNARSYALQITAKAQGEAAAFNEVYTQYALSPEVTRRRMYYETMEDILSRIDKTIVEVPGVTPYLPLPDLQRRREAPAP